MPHRYRRRKQKEPSAAYVVVVLVACFVLLFYTRNSQYSVFPDQYRIYLMIALSILIIAALAIGLYIYLTAQKRSRNYTALRAHQVDTMTGQQFEQFLMHLLIARGYKARVVGGSGDNGIDLIAEKDGERISIQAKRYKNSVSRRAISDALGGMRYHKCAKAMVITNSYFTWRAKDFAKGTDCILIDRDILGSWIRELDIKSL